MSRVEEVVRLLVDVPPQHAGLTVQNHGWAGGAKLAQARTLDAVIERLLIRGCRAVTAGPRGPASQSHNGATTTSAAAAQRASLPSAWRETIAYSA